MDQIRKVMQALSVLQEVFGYHEFRGQQQAIVEHVTAGGDALVLMPTAAVNHCVIRYLQF